MKSWEEMKDFSYVNIKRTKAKSLSLGLHQCKIDKFTRQNPITEHLKFHKLIQKRDNKSCGVCIKSTPPKSIFLTNFQSKSVSMFSQNLKNSPLAKKQSIKQKSLAQLAKKKQRTFFYNNLISPTRKNDKRKVQQNLSKFNKLAQKFNNSLKSSKTNFEKIKCHTEQMNEHFDTSFKAIEFQINEDKGINVHEVIQDHKMLHQQREKEIKKLKDRKLLVSKMNRPIKFPFNESQIKSIVEYEQKHVNKQKQRLHGLIKSLYAYKSQMDYKNKLKIIKQYKQYKG